MSRADGGYYEIYVEWTKKTECDEKVFSEQFDKVLREKWSYYHDERSDTNMLQAPATHFLPQGTFYKWLEGRGKLGGQHKVPKVSNTREIIDQLKLFAKG